VKKVTTSESLITINHYKNLLESEGIAAFLRNHHLGSIVGEMPFTEVWPELWVRDDLDYDRACQLIDDSIKDESPQQGWRCGKCKTENEGQFSMCWSCGADAPTNV
jgi:hypothetical protein